MSAATIWSIRAWCPGHGLEVDVGRSCLDCRAADAAMRGVIFGIESSIQTIAYIVGLPERRGLKAVPGRYKIEVAS